MKMISLAAMLAMMAAPVFAADDAIVKMMVDEKMSKMDSNGDGMISMAEHQDGMNMMFNEADANGDKSLSRDEMMAHKNKEMTKCHDIAEESNDKKTNKKAR
ncbi:MAG: hypothetical protein K2Q01_06240 [Rickettsiales bacterium]|nr:hypothetical protein [Rickettsiales bacterium]